MKTATVPKRCGFRGVAKPSVQNVVNTPQKARGPEVVSKTLFQSGNLKNRGEVELGGAVLHHGDRLGALYAHPVPTAGHLNLRF